MYVSNLVIFSTVIVLLGVEKHTSIFPFFLSSSVSCAVICASAYLIYAKQILSGSEFFVI